MQMLETTWTFSLTSEGILRRCNFGAVLAMEGGERKDPLVFDDDLK